MGYILGSQTHVIESILTFFISLKQLIDLIRQKGGKRASGGCCVV